MMMSVDHSPSWFRRFTDQPLGFFTTAECFVFVSAFLAGMVFCKRFEKLGFVAARASSVHRALRIYRAHLLTVGFAFVLGSFFLSEFPGLKYLLDHYLLNPWTAIAGSVALLFRPPLMDILPMYILFSLLTPLAFWGAQQWGWRTVLFVSFSALAYRPDPCQGPLADCGREPVFRATRSVRSSGLAVLMGWRVVYRPASSWKPATAGGTSLVKATVNRLGDRFSFLALDFCRRRL
jgi:hypothetical protein